MRFYDKVKTLCMRQGEYISNLNKLIPDLQGNKASISHWKNLNNASPYNINLIAKYFDVTPESLVSNDEIIVFNDGSILSIGSASTVNSVVNSTNKTINNTANQNKLSEVESEMLALFSKLSFLEKIEVIQMVHKKVHKEE